MRGPFAHAVRAIAAFMSPRRSSSQPRFFSGQALSLLRDSKGRRWYATLLLSFTGWHVGGLVDRWLVERLTGSGWWLGVAAGAPALAGLVAGLLAGRWADLPGRRRRIVLAWSVTATTALVLLALTATGVIFDWGVLGVAVVCVLAVVRSAAYTAGVTLGRTFQALLVGEDRVDPAARLSALIGSSPSLPARRLPVC